MKRKILLLGLVLTLILTVVMPTTALAAKPVAFTANGTITAVTSGDVFPAGNSGRWVVDERQMFGVITGDIAGDFVLTYAANVDLETQAGSFHGTLEIDSLLFKVRGKSQLIGPGFPGPIVETPYGPTTTEIRTLETAGGWTLTKGAKGTGDYYGLATVLIAVGGPLDGHILYVVPGASGFTMTGQWQP